MIKSLFVMNMAIMMFMVMIMKLMMTMEDVHVCHVQNAFIQDGKRHVWTGLASNLDAAWLLVISDWFEASPRGLIHVKGRINNCVLLIQT